MIDKSVTFTIDADIYEKFCIALNLTNETKDVAVEKCMRWYIAKASQIYNPKLLVRENEDANSDFYGKAIQRIPVWALKSNQYNNKIIRAYFKTVVATGRATIDIMERLCSDENNPELYVPTFKKITHR
ncbi:hypothetical protein [Metabacillus fastidiosus]|uniref:hypothetical protein n=1 Tax=Metabacillus fastidiosus TaxID=1458 RepID=UPI002DB5DB7F|nr:hypothetical protein [Metabacillus fastidiosus]MEC2076115.1 hypothetical protein [Metabacillus fastidiosus]